MKGNKMPLIGINKDIKRTRKNKLAQPINTNRNSLKKKGPILP